MTKLKKTELRDLVKEIYEENNETKVTNKELEPFIDAVFLAIEEALLEGNSVTLGDIGILEVRERSARKGYNPKLLKELKESGVSDEDAKEQAQIDVNASKSVALKASKRIKVALNS